MPLKGCNFAPAFERDSFPLTAFYDRFSIRQKQHKEELRPVTIPVRRDNGIPLYGEKETIYKEEFDPGSG